VICESIEVRRSLPELWEHHFAPWSAGAGLPPARHASHDAQRQGVCVRAGPEELVRLASSDAPMLGVFPAVKSCVRQASVPYRTPRIRILWRFAGCKILQGEWGTVIRTNHGPHCGERATQPGPLSSPIERVGDTGAVGPATESIRSRR
jgi:hypothetical protein